MRQKDVPEYERIRNAIIRVLDNAGGYVPAIDDIYVEQIARNTIDFRIIEGYTDSDHATEETYAKVINSKSIMAKMIRDAIHQLALSRRDRLEKQTRSSLEDALKEATIRAVKQLAEQ
jgi:hypothetical protein